LYLKGNTAVGDNTSGKLQLLGRLYWQFLSLVLRYVFFCSTQKQSHSAVKWNTSLMFVQWNGLSASLQICRKSSRKNSLNFFNSQG